MTTRLDRRGLIKGSALLAGVNALGLGACATTPGSAMSPVYNPRLSPAPVRARPDRLFDITVCLRPFRATGPRLETEQMARTSFKTYRNDLGLPGDPVQWIDDYLLKDEETKPEGRDRSPRPGQLDFAEYHHLIDDLTPRPEMEAPASTPFPTPIVERSSTMMFNIADYDQAARP